MPDVQPSPDRGSEFGPTPEIGPPPAPQGADPIEPGGRESAEPWVLVDRDSFEADPLPPLAGRPRGRSLSKTPKTPTSEK